MKVFSIVAIKLFFQKECLNYMQPRPVYEAMRPHVFFFDLSLLVLESRLRLFTEGASSARWLKALRRLQKAKVRTLALGNKVCAEC